MNDAHFRSKIDTWLVVLIAACFLAGPILVVAFASHSARSVLAGLGISVLASIPPAIVIVWVFRNTHYTLTTTDLVIKSGPLSWTVPLATIRSVRPTRSLFSAPALSLDRIEITYGTYGSVVISPDDHTAFTRALSERVPSADVTAMQRT